MRTAKALVRLCGCAGLPEPSLVAYKCDKYMCWLTVFERLHWPLVVEPPRDKINDVAVHPAKTQISLGIRPV